MSKDKKEKIEEIFDDIIDTLEQQANLSDILISLSDKKTQYIKDNETESLMMLVQDEEKHSSEMIKLEKQRDFFIKKLEKIKNVKITNISALISQFSPENSVRINLIAEKLKMNFEVLKQKNDINTSLLEVILDQVEIYNNLIIGEKVPQTYEDTRYKKNNTNKYTKDTFLGNFDTKY